MEQIKTHHTHSINETKLRYMLDTPELEQPLLEVDVNHQRAGMNYFSGSSRVARVKMSVLPLRQSAPSSDGAQITSFTGFSGIGFMLEPMPRKRPKRVKEWFDLAVKLSEEIRAIFVKHMEVHKHMSPSTPGYGNSLQFAAQEIQALMREEMNKT